MFLLDTNVVSALMTPIPAPEVATWMSRHSADLLFTTALTQAEIMAGLAIMPAGRRRNALEATARIMFRDDFENRILPFDTHAATAYATLFETRRRAGKPTPTIDLMIAAIAQVHQASVVTRNTNDFTDCGIGPVDPWV